MKKAVWLCLAFAAVPALAQTTTKSDTRIRVRKDEVSSTTIMYAPNDSMYIAEARTSGEWYTAPTTSCSSVNLGSSADVRFETPYYTAGTGMTSPDDAKRIALCAVPGQIGRGEMQMTNGRPEYEISIIPNGKRTYTKVIVDANTGAVLSTKQFGGLRGLAGWVRTSLQHKVNTP